MSRFSPLALGQTVSVCFTALLSAALASSAVAAISYDTPDEVYEQDFNGLPTDTRTNNNIQVAAAGFEHYVNGWQDDVDATLTAEDDISILGWYLWHALTPDGITGENGFNHHTRLRFGNGNGTVGSFYGFASTNAANSEKALGFLPSQSVATAPQGDPSGNNDDVMFIALRLTNDTGVTLNEFTLGYDGEQWRDGDRDGGTTPIKFEWAIDPVNVHRIAGFAAVPELGFTSPVAGTTAAAVNGNVEGLAPVDAFTVTDINWQPGSNLWLRWGNNQLDGNDHGLAIDNISFSASVGGVEPPVLEGDQNGDGIVDAADYVAWRKLDEENSLGYDQFFQHFGETEILEIGGSGAVPEPSTLVLVMALVGCALVGRRDVAR